MQMDNILLLNTINNFKKLYLSKKLILLEYYNSTIVSILQDNSNHIVELNSTLVSSKDILDKISKCVRNCNSILELLESKNDNYNIQDIDLLFNEIIDLTAKIDVSFKTLLSKNLQLLSEPIESISHISIENNNICKLNKINQKAEENLSDNNILLISEKMNKVFLPYKISELNKILKNNSSYSNLQEIIDNNYIIPLENFQNSTVARFKEAFSLVKDRSDRKYFFCRRTWFRTCI